MKTLTQAFFGGVFFLGAISGALATESLHHLKAGTFSVEIATDTDRLQDEFGPRFDRTAQVTRAQLGGRQFLESRGLPDEFGLLGLGVLGFDSAAPGDEFVKIGVGRLRRLTDERYRFSTRYPTLETFPVHVEASEQTLTVSQNGTGAGHAYSYQKKYTISELGALTIDYALSNTGEKRFSFDQYNHNFLRFGDALAGPDYACKTEFALPKIESPDWENTPTGLRRKNQPDPNVGSYWGGAVEIVPANNRMQLTHANGQSVAITGDFPSQRFAIWAKHTAISPEVFFRTEIQPGETARWSRSYFFHASVIAGSDFDLIRERARTLLCGGTEFDPNTPEIAAKIRSITAAAENRRATMLRPWLKDDAWKTPATQPTPGGLWPDLDSATDSRHIRFHYERVRDMALAYATHGSPLAGQPTLRDDIFHALEWLHCQRYHEAMPPYDNWFDWEVSTPQALLETLLLLWPALASTPDADKNGVPDIVARYLAPVVRYNPTVGNSSLRGVSMRAANRIFKARIAVLLGAMLRAAPAVERGCLGLSDRSASDSQPGRLTLFAYAERGDGYHRDGTFIQHGAYPYNAGYGCSIEQLAELLHMLEGTHWAVSDPARKIVFRWVHDSCETVIFRGAAHPMFAGRDISEEQSQEHERAVPLLSAIMLLAPLAPAEDAHAFRRMLKAWFQEDTFRPYLEHAPLAHIVSGLAIRNDANLAPRPELLGSHIFTHGDRITHRRPGWMAGLTFFSDRIRNYEMMLGQNLCGWHTGSGQLFIHTADLAHYSENYWATIDFSRLPGTTVEQRDYAPAEGAGQFGASAMAGGVAFADGGAVGCMDFAQPKTTLRARKSWFFFDDEIVCLGAGINDSSEHPVETIAENRRLAATPTKFRVNDELQPVTVGWSAALVDVRTAHLAGPVIGSDLGYIFPGGANLHTSCEKRTGAWFDINDDESRVAHTNTFLSLRLEHGSAPRAASYTYAVLPTATAAATAGRANAAGFSVLENSSQVQAVQDESSGTTGAIFWEDTPTRTANGLLAADRRCALLLRETNSELLLAVSDPTQHADTPVEIRVGRTVTALLESDPRIRVLQLAPELVVRVDLSRAKGATFKARFTITRNTIQ